MTSNSIYKLSKMKLDVIILDKKKHNQLVHLYKVPNISTNDSLSFNQLKLQRNDKEYQALNDLSADYINTKYDINYPNSLYLCSHIQA